MPTVEILVTSGSGNGRAVEIAHRLFRRLAACGYARGVRCFASADDVRAWARRCPPTFSHLLCVGGDATMSAAAGAAVRLAVPLIPVPCGFGNIFARALGHAVRADSIVDLIERGPVRRADIGLAGEDIFLSHRSYGLLEDVQGAVERGRAQPRSRPRRLLAYCSAMAGELLRRMPLSSIDVEVDGTRVAENSALVTVANVETYRGFLTLTPNATPFDGLLDICILPPTSRPRLLARLMILALKLPGRWTGVRLLRGRRVTVTARGRAREDIRVGRGALPLILQAGRGRSGADGAWDRPPESRAA